MNKEPEKLMPITIFNSGATYYRDNRLKQDLLLRAMQLSYDPKIWMKMAGIRSVAELDRTLDRISIRKDYHQKMEKIGMDMEWLVKGLKGLCDTSKSDMVRLVGFKTILKSIGLEDYKDSEGGSSRSWEDILTQSIEDEKKNGKPQNLIEYEVKTPTIPEAEMKRIEMEKEIGKSLYEDKQ